MSDAISTYNRELEAALASAPQYEFSEPSIELVFGDEVVAGCFVLQTTRRYGRGSQVSGSDDDLKQHLLDYLHRRVPGPAVGPMLYFRFVTKEAMKKRMVRHGLDHLL